MLVFQVVFHLSNSFAFNGLALILTFITKGALGASSKAFAGTLHDPLFSISYGSDEPRRRLLGQGVA